MVIRLYGYQTTGRILITAIGCLCILDKKTNNVPAKTDGFLCVIMKMYKYQYYILTNEDKEGIFRLL